MGVKDYYEVLQIHPSAEPFMVLSAYRRLTREYHPDVDPSPDAHQRMILINEAYAVLSDPEQRREYDRNRTKGTGPRVDAGATAGKAQKSESSEKAAWTVGAPPPPSPTDYGIGGDYLTKATEGAAAWQLRKPFIAPWLQFAVRLGSWLGGSAIAFYRGVLEFHIPESALAWSWLAVPFLAECALQAVESMGDARRLKSRFNPEFNPNPSGYGRYADALAKSETQLSSVYVSRSWKYHTDPHCYGMTNSSEMPRWDAERRNAQACSRCGFYSHRAIPLPPPFGPRSTDMPLNDPPDSPGSRGQRVWWKVAVYAVAGCCALFALSGVERPSVQVVQIVPASLASTGPMPVSNASQVVVLPGTPNGDGQSFASCISSDGRSIVGFERPVDAGLSVQPFVWAKNQGMRSIPFPNSDVTIATPNFISPDGKIVAGGYSVGNSYEAVTIFSFETGYQKVPDDLLAVKYISPDQRTLIGEGLVSDRRIPVVCEDGKMRSLVATPKDIMGSLIQVSDDGRVSLVKMEKVRRSRTSFTTHRPLLKIVSEEYQVVVYGQTLANLGTLSSCTEITSACLSRNGRYVYCVGRSGEQGQQLCAVDLTTFAVQKTLVDPVWKAVTLSSGTDDGLTAFGATGTNQSNSDAIFWKISESPVYFRDLAVKIGLWKSLKGWRVVGIVASSADGKRLACQGESHDKYSALFIDLGS